jgi:hypothetical protein
MSTKIRDKKCIPVILRKEKFPPKHKKMQDNHFTQTNIIKNKAVILLIIHMKSLVPKRNKSIFVYLRKMQSKFEIYWKMH